MDFYKIYADQKDEYVYAKKVREPNMFKFEKCPVCNRVSQYRKSSSFSVDLSPQSVFPDLMEFANSPGELIISEKALTAFETEQITGFVPHRIAVYKNNTELTDRIYYYLTITGKGEIDYHRMGIEVVGICSECNKFFFKDHKNTYPIAYLDEKTRDGTDIYGNGYCTEKVLYAIYKYNLSGFRIKKGIYSDDALNREFVNLAEMFGG